MKNILLLFTRRSVEKGQSHPENLCQALQKAAGGTARYEFSFYDDLQHVIAPHKAAILLPDGRPLDSFDLVYQRRWITKPEEAAAVAIFLRKRGVPFVDDEAYSSGWTDKLVQYWRMWEQDIPFPRTFYVPPARLTEWLKDNLGKIIDLPCVMKSSKAQRGGDNYLVQTVEEAAKLAADQPGLPFLIQEFIPNDHDYRVLVCGDEIGLVIKRTAAGGSYKNNTSQGGAAETVPSTELPPPARQACIKAARVFGRQIAGVDIVFDKRHPDAFYIFEVNRSPQIDTASFVDQKADVINRYFMARAGQESEK